MAPPLSVNIVYNKTNTYGLTDDISVIERLLRKLQDSIGQPIGKARLLDIREPSVHCDIQFHLEIPVFSAIPWSHTNIILVNPEQWAFAYDAYVHAFDALLFRDDTSAEQFRRALSERGVETNNIYVVPWCPSWQIKDRKRGATTTAATAALVEKGFVCFLAGSKSKFEYIKQVVNHWTDYDPALTIYTTRSDFADALGAMQLPSNVSVVCKDMDVDSRYRIMAEYGGHLVCSQGESYGYAAANAEVAGAFTIMNDLPVFQGLYGESTGVAWLSNSYEDSTRVRYSMASPTANIRDELAAAFEAFRSANLEEIRNNRQAMADHRFQTSCTAFLPMLSAISTLAKERRPTRGTVVCPPVVYPDDCPPISIITPTYNREKLIDIAFHNLLATDYPKNKIEWVVIEDNEKAPHLASEKIISFQIQVPEIKLKYIPIEGRMSIGEKRNIAIEHASNDIILFMDDDDHYPTTSFRRRVAWLTKGTKRGQTGKAAIACCTTLALYDLKFGTSAINVPPFDIPFAQRISEATLTFRKSAWVERKFPNVSVSEGENWISGREEQVIEMPPQQIIVAFSHGTNQSSRRVPPSENKPGCFWGFAKEYLMFIHGLVGIQVEEDTRASKK